MTQKTQSRTSIKGNTKSLIIRARKYTMTWNNYTEIDYNYTKEYCEKQCIKYVIGKEKSTKNTPHLQIYMRFKNPKSFNTLKKAFPKCHIEKAKGTDVQNLVYCTKEKKFISNYDNLSFKEKTKKLIMEEEYKNVKWRPFQSEILELINMKPDKRKIFWYYELSGNVGKSYLCKYITMCYDGVIIAEGKKMDVYNQIKNMIEEEILPNIILLDIPRTSIEYINYGAIECIKNGLIYSGKYEGSQCYFPIPHVIVFSNEEPQYDKMSIDRFIVKEIK